MNPLERFLARCSLERNGRICTPFSVHFSNRLADNHGAAAAVSGGQGVHHPLDVLRPPERPQHRTHVCRVCGVVCGVRGCVRVPFSPVWLVSAVFSPRCLHVASQIQHTAVFNYVFDFVRKPVTRAGEGLCVSCEKWMLLPQLVDNSL